MSKWQVASGKWQMANGKWQMANRQTSHDLSFALLPFAI
jgi:hypothetical protein